MSHVHIAKLLKNAKIFFLLITCHNF
uniref:Uncharacterized protein n=1 Tax=Rhizophora mucronata TaxID=61149 RepID=A0A2P2QZX9_RHIMU